MNGTENYLERNKEITIQRLRGRTYVSIAREYNLSNERIRQIVYKILRKIRHINNLGNAGKISLIQELI